MRPTFPEELQEEECWEMERYEAMERERLRQQIDDFDAWEELAQPPRPASGCGAWTEQGIRAN